MTPYELSKLIHKDISPVAPRLCAALNRALVEIGEGSALIGFGPGTHENDNVSFQEYESISLHGADPAQVISRINAALEGLAHSSWKVIIDRKPGQQKGQLELLYTLYRSKE